MKKILILLVVLGSMLSCAEFVETEFPKSSVAGASVFENDISAVASVSAILSDLSNGTTVQGANSVGLIGGLLSDELENLNVDLDQIEVHTNTVSRENTKTGGLWIRLYNLIYKANMSIEGAGTSVSLTPAIRNQVIGEAKFLRALMYFYLVNLWGDVPLVLSSNYEHSRSVARTPKEQVYVQIIADLNDAATLLSTDYLSFDGRAVPQRHRPNRRVANALLSRVYLYTRQWVAAEAACDAVLEENGATLPTVSLNTVFSSATTPEVLWALAPAMDAAGAAQLFTNEAGRYNLTVLKLLGWAPSNDCLTNHVMERFTANDLRKSAWVDSVTVSGRKYYLPYKYKTDAILLRNVQDYFVMLRMGEVFLIRAEARIQQDRVDDGMADVNSVRRRAGLVDTVVTSRVEAMKLVEAERIKELFSELGHRWFDLKRWQSFDDPSITRAEEVMSVITPLKGGQWNNHWLLLPIPDDDILTNPAMEQNEGYF